jgi:lipoate-protein ligase A
VFKDRKVSGTAQARKRFGLLQHLTLLWHLGFAMCERALREPEKSPDYRQARKHSYFITTFIKKMNIP